MTSGFYRLHPHGTLMHRPGVKPVAIGNQPARLQRGPWCWCDSHDEACAMFKVDAERDRLMKETKGGPWSVRLAKVEKLLKEKKDKG